MLATFRFASVLLTGLALIAPGAHLFALPNKIALAGDSYFIVQQIYAGWWIAGLLLPLACITNLIHAVLARSDAVAAALGLGAAVCLVANLVIFFLLTQPTNAATHNWLVQPDDWQRLRQQWEYSHTINAGVTCAAFILAIGASLRSARVIG